MWGLFESIFKLRWSIIYQINKRNQMLFSWVELQRDYSLIGHFPPKSIEFLSRQYFLKQKKWIKSSNNNVILKTFKSKIYFGYHIHLQLCYKQYKIRFYLQIVQSFKNFFFRYTYAIVKIMCPPGYHHNGFVATHTLGHMM